MNGEGLGLQGVGWDRCRGGFPDFRRVLCGVAAGGRGGLSGRWMVGCFRLRVDD